MKKKVLSSNRTIAAALTAIVLVCYGIYIPWFGFYGDDWIYIYNHYLLGAGSFGDFVAVDRPYSAWVYSLTTPVFGDRAVYYHLLLLSLRLASVFLFWWMLRLVWPGKPRLAFWAALLFAVYPGFQQEPIAVQFILHFVILDLFFLSMVCMLLAVKKTRWRWLLTAGGVFCSMGLFSLEYFAGLEILRPALLWMAIAPQGAPAKRRALRFFLNWLPYLLVLAGFAVWRIFIFQFPTYQPDVFRGLIQDPAGTLPALARRIAGDLKTVVFDAWRQTFRLPESRMELIVFLALTLAVFILTLMFLKRLKYDDRMEENPTGGFWQNWMVQAAGISLLALLGAGVPFWATGIKVELSFPWDRSTLPFMVGACLLAVVMLEWIIQPRFQVILLAGLVALSAGLHYRNALIYKGEWENLRTYFSQMAWRMPGLEKGTILVSDEIPLYRFSDNDLTPIVNWMYAPEVHDANIPYKYFDLSTRMDSALPGIAENLPVVHNYRNHLFASTTSQVLSIYYRSAGCLYVLGPEDQDFPGLPQTVLEMLPISHFDQVDLNREHDADLPPAFLGEAPRDWCYYFEKADLARQKADWGAISKLAKQAETLGLVQHTSFELLPFIEGFAHTGEVERFRQYVELAREDEQIQPILCSRLKNIRRIPGLEVETLRAIDDAGCNLN